MEKRSDVVGIGYLLPGFEAAILAGSPGEAELRAHNYFPITSIGTVMVFGGMQAFWSQAW